MEAAFLVLVLILRPSQKEPAMSYGSFFYGAVVGAPKMPDYGVAINIKYYGIFTRKQAQKRIRKDKPTD